MLTHCACWKTVKMIQLCLLPKNNTVPYVISARLKYQVLDKSNCITVQQINYLTGKGYRYVKKNEQRLWRWKVNKQNLEYHEYQKRLKMKKIDSLLGIYKTSSEKLLTNLLVQIMYIINMFFFLQRKVTFISLKNIFGRKCNL